MKLRVVLPFILLGLSSCAAKKQQGESLGGSLLPLNKPLNLISSGGPISWI